MEMKIKRRKNQYDQEEIRFKVADYLKKRTGTQKQVSIIYCITERAVNKIWAKYKKNGNSALKNNKRGVNQGKKLKKEQAYQISQIIKTKLPEQLKLSFGLWTREAVQQLIFTKFGVELSRWQVVRYLKKWGFTSQKPIKKAFEQKSEKVQKWLEEEYPAIKKRAIKEKAIIYFGDKTGCKRNHQSEKNYASKKQNSSVMATEKHFDVNMISGISNKGHLQFMLMEKEFNSEVFKIFLIQMIKYSRRKIFFITDNRPSHNTKKLFEWLEENKEKIEVLFIPPYSPERNSQEYLNQDLRANIIDNKRAVNKGQINRDINNFMNKRKEDNPLIKKYFHHNHTMYAV